MSDICPYNLVDYDEDDKTEPSIGQHCPKGGRMSAFIGVECPVCGHIMGGAPDTECPGCGAPYSELWDTVKYDPVADVIVWRLMGRSAAHAPDGLNAPQDERFAEKLYEYQAKNLGDAAHIGAVKKGAKT